MSIKISDKVNESLRVLSDPSKDLEWDYEWETLKCIRSEDVHLEQDIVKALLNSFKLGEDVEYLLIQPFCIKALALIGSYDVLCSMFKNGEGVILFNLTDELLKAPIESVDGLALNIHELNLEKVKCIEDRFQLLRLLMRLMMAEDPTVQNKSTILFKKFFEASMILKFPLSSLFAIYVRIVVNIIVKFNLTNVTDRCK